jgi:acetyltransferase-like isoleucine patch superfamily enzyme
MEFLSDHDKTGLLNQTKSGNKIDFVPGWRWYKPPIDSSTVPSTINGPLERLHLGNNASFGLCHFNVQSGDIFLLDWVKLSQHVSLLTGGHDITKKNANRAKMFESGNDIVLEEGVMVFNNVTIIGPCRIGAHSVVAAGSIVRPGIYPGNSLYAGNPAVFKKQIEFTE